MPGLIWTASALRDLADLDAYLIEQDAFPSAVRIIGDIRAAADRLCDYPGIGRWIAEDVRAWPVARTAYVLLYTVEPDDVAILRVLHERRNWRDERSSLA